MATTIFNKDWKCNGLQLHLTVTLTIGKMAVVGLPGMQVTNPHHEVVIKNLFIKKNRDSVELERFMLVSAHVNPLICDIHNNTSSL